VLGADAFQAAGVSPLPPYGHKQVADVIAACVVYTGQPGLHLIAPRARIAELIADVERAGAGGFSADDVERLRIRAGWARWGNELTEDTLPLEAALADALSFSKGCYSGQEVIARVSARGHVNWQLVGMMIQGDGAPAQGTVLSGEGRPEAARVTSSCAWPDLGVIALGYAFRTHAAPGTPLRLADGRAATIVALPFVRQP